MVSSVGQAWAIMKGRRMGNQNEAAGLLEGMPPGVRKARQVSEAKTNSRPKSYANKYRMGMRLY